MPTYNSRTSQHERSAFDSISGFVVANNIVFTTESNRGRFIITNIKSVTKALVGTGTLPTISVGWTASNYNDAVNLYQLTQTTVNANENLTLVPNLISIPANTQVFVRVSTAATGYTTMGFQIYIEGYYEN